MAFDTKPATVTLKPVGVNPTVGPQRRALVVARNPIESVAVPSPMTRDTGVSTPWWWRTGRFGYEGWRGVGSIDPSFRFLRNQNKVEHKNGGWMDGIGGCPNVGGICMMSTRLVVTNSPSTTIPGVTNIA